MTMTNTMDVNNANEGFHSGYIAIIGRANAGKSTLLNSIIEQKVSIVSPKPQTTRNKILGIWTEDNTQMIFVDTPGMLRPNNRLGEFMVKSIDTAVKDVNCILVVIDGHNGIKEEDIAMLSRYSSLDTPTIAVVTKTDISQAETLMLQLNKLNGLQKIDSVWAVSARQGKNIKQLRDYLKKFMTDTIAYFEDDFVTDRSQRFLVCELIREKILLLLNEEVPHGVGVQLNKMEYDTERKLWDIDANIIIEKQSHKPIIIGKNGSMIKDIGIYARKSIEKMLDGRVYLSLWIKVKEDWRNSDFLMKDIGYDKNEEN
ncbi:MAG: GTPase Era [Clostridia bacterium]